MCIEWAEYVNIIIDIPKLFEHDIAMLVMYKFHLSIGILFKTIRQYKTRKNCRGEMNVYIVGLRRWNADIVMLVLHISIYLFAFIAIYGSDLK